VDRRRGGVHAQAAERCGTDMARREQRPFAIDGFAERVDHAAKPGDGRPHRSCYRCHQRTAAAAHAFQRRERHQQCVLSREPDDFARNVVARRFDHHAGADRHCVQRAGNFHHQAADADDAPINLNAVEFVNLFGQRLHGATGNSVRSVTCNAPVLTLCLPAPLIIALVLGKEMVRQTARWANLPSQLAPELNLICERPRGSKTNF
jgi:hypothetical protein